MNSLCNRMRDKIEDYILEALSQQEMDILQEHIHKCPECRKHIQMLENEKDLLLDLGKVLRVRMAVGKDRAIKVLNNPISIEQIIVDRDK